jgi:hypothetical protein
MIRERGYESMGNTLTSYTDDNLTRQALAAAGSERTLHEIYGLFYGFHAAPDPSDADERVTVIFDDEDAAAASEADAEVVRANLLSLWNFIGRWKPETEPFYFPEKEYAADCQGVLQHLQDDVALVQYFMAGLKLGNTDTEDFSEDAVDAMNELTEALTQLERHIAELSASDMTAADSDPDSTAKMLDELEEVLADNIARVTLGLKPAKR